MGRDTLVLDYTFYGKKVPAATASVVDGPWCLTDASSAGSPVAAVVGSELSLLLASTDEVENLCVSWGDVLSMDIDDLLCAEFWFRLTGMASTNIAFVGLGSARADDTDALTAMAGFKVTGTGNIVVESDDGTTDKDDIATGIAASSTFATSKKCVIDFASGIYSASPPASSAGGKANVLFSMENASGLMVPVARTTRFDMSAYSAGLQPIFQIQKDGTGTDSSVPNLFIKRARFTLKC